MVQRSMKARFILATFLLTTVFLFASSIPPVGSVAPAFTLNSQEGKPVSLNAYRGKWVVLYFYPKDFSSGCTVEAHNFERDQAQYQERNAVVLGVSLDTAISHKQFCAKEGLEFKLLSDADHKVSSEYGSFTNLALVKFASRHTFIINPEGSLVPCSQTRRPGLAPRCGFPLQLGKHRKNFLAVLAGNDVGKNSRNYRKATDSRSRIEENGCFHALKQTS